MPESVTISFQDDAGIWREFAVVPYDATQHPDAPYSGQPWTYRLGQPDRKVPPLPTISKPRRWRLEYQTSEPRPTIEQMMELEALDNGFRLRTVKT